MPAVVIAPAYGGPEVLSVVDQPVPDPGPGEARIEVKAAGVNPVDRKAYSGAFGSDPDRLPIRLGSEAAGVVTATGPDAVGPAGPLAVGDEVIAFRASGAYAAELVVPAQALVPKPSVLDWAQASGLMLTGVTAWHTLTATGVTQGDTVLIHAATGGVGLMAVQLAAARGAMVVATASPARHELLRELGAVPVAYATAWPTGFAPRRRAGSTPRWTSSAPTRPLTSRWRSSPTGRASPRSPRSGAGRRKGSRFWAAAPGPTRAPRSATRRAWNWPVWPRIRPCGSS